MIRSDGSQVANLFTDYCMYLLCHSVPTVKTEDFEFKIHTALDGIRFHHVDISYISGNFTITC